MLYRHDVPSCCAAMLCRHVVPSCCTVMMCRNAVPSCCAVVVCRGQQVDPTGKRTIGVLTKPDLINPGGEAEVLEVLSNNRKPLKLGYVMVKV